MSSKIQETIGHSTSSATKVAVSLPRSLTIRDPEEIKRRATTTLSRLDCLFKFMLFISIALFVGVFLVASDQRSLENRSHCDPTDNIVKQLLVFEVLSFSLFILSAGLIQCLKLKLNKLMGRNEGFKNPSSALVFKIVAVTGVVIFTMGMICAVLSFMKIFQIKLVMLSCGSEYTLQTLIYMFVISILGTMLFAFNLCYDFVIVEII
jgi:hypothetical protein